MVDRPDIYDPEVLLEVARKLAPKVMAWDSEGEYDPEELAESLRKGMEDAFDFDAYKIVRALDDDGWMVDAELVRIFDDALPLALNERDKAVAKWAQEQEVKPVFKIGDRVQSRRRFNGSVGEITKVDAEKGRYLLFNPHAGHVREGVGTHGVWENFEDVEEVRNDSGDQRGSG